jgi:RND family efflux transporter MFP subunit
MFVHAAIALGIVAGALVGVNTLFATAPGVAKRQRPERRAALVEVALANPKQVELQVRASGLSQPVQSVQVIPQVQGTITSLSADFVPGRIVKKGTVLATIEPRDYRLAVQRAQSAVAQANATLALEAGNQDLARLESSYLEDLVTDENRDLVMRKPQLATAKAALRSAQVAVQQAQLDLSRTRIIAPFDAVILDRNAAVGRLATPQNSLATLAGTDEWWIRAEVPVQELVQLKEGSAAKVSLPSLWGSATRPGTIVQANSQVEAQGRLGSLLVSVPDPLSIRDTAPPKLLINMRYEIALAGETVENAVALKPAWVHGDDEVWVMDAEDKLAFRTIQVALRSADQVIATSGLAAGERIVTSRLASPVPGMKLRLGDEPAGKPGASAKPKAKE